ncbi:MAG: hypothetical protein LBU85_07165 [Treponema sp.]|nr:hypothetical protein [Treponema sp.]
MEDRIRNTLFAVLLVFLAGGAFSQTDELLQRGSIPEELLRPRREEAPRYPIDTVIGPIGQGQAPAEAYGLARRAAAALLEGNMNAPVLSSVNKVFLEGCISALNVVNPRYFRLGSGREEPDGSVSFLVRFAGREQSITGELFIRFEERVTNPPPPTPSEPPAPVTESEDETAGGEDASIAAEAEPAPPEYVPIIEKKWIFEDLILESPRTREEEIIESRQRYDFSPYERFF